MYPNDFENIFIELQDMTACPIKGCPQKPT